MGILTYLTDVLEVAKLFENSLLGNRDGERKTEMIGLIGKWKIGTKN